MDGEQAPAITFRAQIAPVGTGLETGDAEMRVQFDIFATFDIEGAKLVAMRGCDVVLTITQPPTLSQQAGEGALVLQARIPKKRMSIKGGGDNTRAKFAIKEESVLVGAELWALKRRELEVTVTLARENNIAEDSSDKTPGRGTRRRRIL